MMQYDYGAIGRSANWLRWRVGLRIYRVGSLMTWAVVMAAGWVALSGVLFARSLWDVPSAITEFAPWLYQPVAPLLTLSWFTAPRNSPWIWLPLSVVLLYLILVGSLWVVYLQAVRLAARLPAAQLRRPWPLLAGILLVGLVFGGLAIWWPGLFSSDIYYYAAEAKMQVVYHLNPLVQPPAAMIGDPWLATTPAVAQYSPYGPVWQLSARLVGTLAELLGGARPAYIFSFRLFNLGLVALAAVLIWAIGGQLGWTVRHRAMATVLFAWCPLLIIELPGDGHNDALLVVGLLLALWLHLRRAWPLAVMALVAAGLVKLPGLFLLPAYLLLLWRTSDSRAAALRRMLGSAGAALVPLAAYIPYADPALGQTTLANPMAGIFAASPANALRWLIIDGALQFPTPWTPPGLTAHAVSEAIRWPLWYVAVGLWGVVAVYCTWQVRDFAGLLRGWALILFSYLLIGSVWFQPWYATWVIPLLALLPAGRLRRALLLLVLGAGLCYAVSPYIPGDTTRDLRHFYVAPVIFLPTLVYCARQGWRMLPIPGRARLAVPR